MPVCQFLDVQRVHLLVPFTYYFEIASMSTGTKLLSDVLVFAFVITRKTNVACCTLRCLLH